MWMHRMPLGHAVRFHVLRLCVARVVPHNLAILLVTKEIDAVPRRLARQWLQSRRARLRRRVPPCSTRRRQWSRRASTTSWSGRSCRMVVGSKTCILAVLPCRMAPDGCSYDKRGPVQPCPGSGAALMWAGAQNWTSRRKLVAHASANDIAPQ